MKGIISCYKKEKKYKGIIAGIMFGLIPHSFCITFILFSIIGSAVITTFLKKILLIPNLFYFLVLISLLLATISAMIHLKRKGCLCGSNKEKWKYLSILYSVTILVNLLMFFVLLPALTSINLLRENSSSQKVSDQENNLSELSITVEIPCTGHAALIIDEIKKNYDIQSVTFQAPNMFNIKYDPKKTSLKKIIALDIFKTYPATIN